MLDTLEVIYPTEFDLEFGEFEAGYDPEHHQNTNSTFINRGGEVGVRLQSNNHNRYINSVEFRILEENYEINRNTIKVTTTGDPIEIPSQITINDDDEENDYITLNVDLYQNYDRRENIDFVISFEKNNDNGLALNDNAKVTIIAELVNSRRENEEDSSNHFFQEKKFIFETYENPRPSWARQ